MTSLSIRCARLGLAALGAGTFIAAPAAAQTAPSAAARPDDALSHNLRLLAANPKSLTALMGAGKAALELGDAQAALTFFARAENVAPQDGRIKMWIGSALVQLQQPRSALKFFQDAVSAGVPEAEVAKERGLAHDILGEPRRAQADYRAALQRDRDDEVTRRLALSLAISGEREPALRLLEDQLLARDRSAERTRAMVLGLTGDATGAARAAQSSMAPAQASAMAPFLAQLPALNPTERALAVHLGLFPGDGRTRPLPATTIPSFASASTTQAGRPDTSQPSLGRRKVTLEPVSTEPRRRPGAETQLAANAVRTPTPAPAAKERPKPRPAIPARDSAWSWSRGVSTVSRTPTRTADTEPTRRTPSSATPAPAAVKPTQVAQTTTPPVQRQVAAAAPVPTATPAPAEQPTVIASVDVPPTDAANARRIEVRPGFTIGRTDMAASTAPVPAPATPEPDPVPVEAQRPIQLAELAPSTVAAATTPPPGDTVEAASPIVPQSEQVRGSRLADVAAAIASLPDPEPAKVQPKKEAPVRAAAAATTTTTKKPVKPAAAAEPSRHWVQVAGGADKTALPRTYAALKSKAPKLLGARGAWTTPLNATNRLLVGPFGSSKEAQEFVNELAKSNVSAFAWTSDSGQKIDRLAAK